MQDLLENTRFNSWSNWLHILLLLERYWRTLNINHTVWSMLSLVVWTFSCLLGKQETKWLIRKFQPPWGHQSNLYGGFFLYHRENNFPDYNPVESVGFFSPWLCKGLSSLRLVRASEILVPALLVALFPLPNHTATSWNQSSIQGLPTQPQEDDIESETGPQLHTSITYS